MTSSNSGQGQFSIYTLMRQAVREEIERIFGIDDVKNTSVNLLSVKEQEARGTPVRRRNGLTAKPAKAVKGRVTRPDDKRLKANREL